MITYLKYRLGQLFYFIWSLFLKGFLALLPITLTVGLLTFTFKKLKEWLHPIYQMEPAFLKAIPFSEFLLTFCVILAMGFILNSFILQSFWDGFESLVNKIPIVRPIYSGIKQLVQALNPDDQSNFKQVVLIEFPKKGVYTVGFVTSELGAHLSPNHAEAYFTVFVPTTPNPTSGFFLVVNKSDAYILNISRQEAMTMIISGGTIQPPQQTL